VKNDVLNKKHRPRHKFSTSLRKNTSLSVGSQ